MTWELVKEGYSYVAVKDGRQFTKGDRVAITELRGTYANGTVNGQFRFMTKRLIDVNVRKGILVREK